MPKFNASGKFVRHLFIAASRGGQRTDKQTSVAIENPNFLSGLTQLDSMHRRHARLASVITSRAACNKIGLWCIDLIRHQDRSRRTYLYVMFTKLSASISPQPFLKKHRPQLGIIQRRRGEFPPRVAVATKKANRLNAPALSASSGCRA